MSHFPIEKNVTVASLHMCGLWDSDDDEKNLSALVQGIQVSGQVQIQAVDSCQDLEQYLVSVLPDLADQI